MTRQLAELEKVKQRELYSILNLFSNVDLITDRGDRDIQIGQNECHRRGDCQGREVPLLSQLSVLTPLIYLHQNS
ncbi:MAG TPA: hypothetical protein V6C71_24835 [Coleofasciculaceae cyanobacterium]